MPSPRVARAGQLAAQLTGAGVPATHDPRDLTGRLPGVLVLPPRLAFTGYSGPVATWRLLIVASTANELDAWTQIDTLAEQVADLLPVETGEPASYASTAVTEPLPAYALTFEETVES